MSEVIEEAAAERLLERLRDLNRGLDARQRELLAALLAPGLAAAHDPPEVEGFDIGAGERPLALPTALTRVLEREGVRVVSFGDEDE